jgi:uncharacterized protein YqcC (DUF446 family)
MKEGILTVYFKLRKEDFLASHEVRTAIMEALGHTPGVPVERTQAEDLELRAFEAFAAADAAAEASRTSARDPYEEADCYMTKLERVMKEENLWPGDKPEGEIEVRGAFGCENMAFTQWLAWILIERVRDIVRERGEFPRNSQVAVYARREFDGVTGGDAVTDVLMRFDDFIETLGRQNG